MADVVRLGIGGPVGSGKTRLVESLVPELIRAGLSVAVITNDLVTDEDAQRVRRSGVIDPERVLAAELWYKTVPEHRFYSPEGHTLFVHVGYLSAEQIRKVIDYYKTGWENWAETGEEASWMTFR